MSILNRISPKEVAAAAHAIWPDKSTADKIASSTVEIINKTHKRKFSFFNGKSSKSLVGGLFYLLGFRYDKIKKQRELAWRLGTTDVTIRTSYRQWLEEFPDLFLDIIGKLGEHDSLRYYVLLNPKMKALQSEKAVSTT